jgi:predicted transcriptional regulator
MFLSAGLEQLDPALLAFVKCHVTSPPKWEALRALASHTDVWLTAQELAHATHREPSAVGRALRDLAAEGVVEEQLSEAGCPRYRLPDSEPTTVVLHRLIEAATHSQEFRMIIATYLQNTRINGHSQAAA